jgi:hypothetical protein
MPKIWGPEYYGWLGLSEVLDCIERRLHFTDEYCFESFRLQVRMTHGAVCIVFYDRLALSPARMQLVWSHVVPLAAQRTLTSSQSWY